MAECVSLCIALFIVVVACLLCVAQWHRFYSVFFLLLGMNVISVVVAFVALWHIIWQAKEKKHFIIISANLCRNNATFSNAFFSFFSSSSKLIAEFFSKAMPQGAIMKANLSSSSFCWTIVRIMEKESNIKKTRQRKTTREKMSTAKIAYKTANYSHLIRLLSFIRNHIYPRQIAEAMSWA